MPDMIQCVPLHNDWTATWWRCGGCLSKPATSTLLQRSIYLHVSTRWYTVIAISQLSGRCQHGFRISDITSSYSITDLHSTWGRDSTKSHSDASTYQSGACVMKRYQYKPLNSGENRLLRLLPGRSSDAIVIELSH